MIPRRILDSASTLAAQVLDHVTADIQNRILDQGTGKSRHVLTPLPDHSHDRMDARRVLQGRTTTMPSLSLGAVTGGTVCSVHLGSVTEVRHRSPGGPADFCRHVGRIGGPQGPLEREEPDAISSGASTKLIAGREDHDVLLPVLLEHTGWSIDPGVCLEFPQMLSGGRIECHETSVASADEDQSSRCNH